MSDTPLVSVIIPFYNTPEQFIREAIESVLAQRFGHWELFLVDDGSDGPCTSIAKQYVLDHPGKIFYLEHKEHQNKGHSASRNLGISYSKGEYITFLDSDDVLLPNKLEQQLEIMAKRPEVGMVYGKTLYWWSWTRNTKDRVLDRIQDHAIQADMPFNPPSLLILFLHGRAAVPSINSIMVRSEIVERISGFEEKFRVLYGDQAFYAKVCLEYPVFVSENCWDKYRQHPNSVCTSASKTQILSSHRAYLKWLNEYLSLRGYRNTEVWRALKIENMLRRYWNVGRPIKRAQRFIWRRQRTYPLCVKK